RGDRDERQAADLAQAPAQREAQILRQEAGIEAAIEGGHGHAWSLLSGLAEHGDNAMKRIGRGLLVVHHGDADVVRAGIAAVLLPARAVASGQDAHAPVAPQPRGRGLAATVRRDVEPQEEAAGGSTVAVSVADDLVSEVEFQPVKI